MSAVDEKLCDERTRGFKKVCEEKHAGVEQRFLGMESQVKSINNKLLAILLVIIAEVVLVVFKGF